MKKIWSLLITLIFFIGLCRAQSENVFWIDYEGKLGEMDILLSYAKLSNGSLVGNYCYKKYDKRIVLNGNISGGKVEFTEYLDGVPNGYFTGQIINDENTHMEGTWMNLTKSKTLRFSLKLTSMCGGKSDFRYSDALRGTNESVEDFMKHVKSSVINGEREWIANHIHYPINTTINNHKVVINNRAELIDNFDQVFHKEFIDKIQASYTCNLFVKDYYGVMLGNGEIWINDKQALTETKFDYEISAINNRSYNGAKIATTENQPINDNGIATSEDKLVIAGKIFYGMNSVEANKILNSDFVTIKLGEHTLNEVHLITEDAKVVGISYKSKLAGMIIKNTESSSGNPFGDICPRCKVIFSDCENIEEALSEKGYELLYKKNSSLEVLDPFRDETLVILEKGDKIVGFKALTNEGWELIMTCKAVKENPVVFKSIFNISLNKATSDMRDVF